MSVSLGHLCSCQEGDKSKRSTTIMVARGKSWVEKHVLVSAGWGGPSQEGSLAERGA